MIEFTEIHGGVLLAEGQEYGRNELREAARAYMRQRVDALEDWTTDEMVERARVDRAWYSSEIHPETGEETGFAQEHHGGARAVSIVVLPDAPW